MRQKPAPIKELDKDFKYIEGYRGFYCISNNGEVWSCRRKRYLKRVPNPKYLVVSLSKNNIKDHKLVHHLVAEAFIGKRPKGKFVNHKDTNKLNNNFSNLEYVTNQENVIHAVKYGVHSFSKGHKFCGNQYMKIKHLGQGE